MQLSTLIPSLPASDIVRAKRFYAEALDLKPAEEWEDGSARYECGDSWFLLYPSQFAGSNQATAGAWEVSDIAATVAELKSRGVSFEQWEMPDIEWRNGIASLPDGTKGAWFKDSEGNILGLFHRA